MAKRMFVMVFGVILFLIGASAAIAGGALMVIFGADSTIASGREPLSTQRTALVVSMNDIKDTNGFATVVGQPTLRLSIDGVGRDLFVGIGSAAAVDQYLAKVSIDRVTDLEVDPFKLKTSPRDGAATPAAPGAQTFWTARGSGSTAELNWKVSDGSYRLVVMNADASPVVNAAGLVELKVPSLFAIGIGILCAGVVVGLVGLALLIIGVRMGPYRQPPAPVGAGYPGAPDNVGPRGDKPPL
ncbi:MAG: hypothetical protein QOG22_1889 [Pseudonocardiales bacterium]|nr:hypothetical protein [Pseudonocardiales bacterium]